MYFVLSWRSRYFVEVSINKNEWEIVADFRNEDRESVQRITFPEKLVIFIRIVGTFSASNDVSFFNVANFLELIIFAEHFPVLPLPMSSSSIKSEPKSEWNLKWIIHFFITKYVLDFIYTDLFNLIRRYLSLLYKWMYYDSQGYWCSPNRVDYFHLSILYGQ